MSRVASLTAAQRLLLKGQGVAVPFVSALTGAVTAGAAASGYFTGALSANQIGTTVPGTMQGFPLPPGVAAALRQIATYQAQPGGNGQTMHAIFYKIGTVNLAATGNQFTHDAATFPVLRTRFGVASQPVQLIPFIQVTTATTVTAPQFKVANVAASNGYVDEAGNTVVGTKTFTFPAAATAANSTYLMPLNDGSNGVRDITNLNVTVAGSAGAATVWGMEIVALGGQASTSHMMMHDTLTSGLTLARLQPAVATSGTATSFLGVISHNAAARASYGLIVAAQDT